MHRVGSNAAHLARLLLTVGVTGVGVSAVADNPLCVAVRNILTCDSDGGPFDQILRICSGRRAANVTANHCQITLVFVAAHTAVDSRSLKAERSGNSAGDNA